MGWWDQFKRTEAEVGPPTQDYKPQAAWYAARDGNAARFVAADGGMPPLHLIRYRDSNGETVLRLCEDSTGLLVGPTDRLSAPAGTYVPNLQAESYYKAACKACDFSPGAPVRLKGEPYNNTTRSHWPSLPISTMRRSRPTSTSRRPARSPHCSTEALNCAPSLNKVREVEAESQAVTRQDIEEFRREVRAFASGHRGHWSRKLDSRP
ncbi:hypothetical protein GCM10023153_24740 [Ornithinibacter aureus]|uniref:Uncharacterized protein n=1 Tax=Ornithinibacter aureus TaxID=622664 RepID=A0ABP8K1B3_9MICO|nr:hypothetical protein C8E84_0856 [Ornithinibacter aureus]